MSELLVGSGYGRTVALRGSVESLAAARSMLPFWWVESSGEPEEYFDLSEPAAAPLILRNLERWVAEHADGFVFVHAAVVSVGGRALVMPGQSYSGKTTLCAELLGRGAHYMSDEFAVLDLGGAVHPYPRPLQLRTGTERRLAPADSLGAATATGAQPPGLVALLRFESDRGWDASDISGGQAVMAVLEHTFCARSRPEAALTAAIALVAATPCIQGSRGPAAEAVDPLLRRLTS